MLSPVCSKVGLKKRILNIALQITNVTYRHIITRYNLSTFDTHVLYLLYNKRVPSAARRGAILAADAAGPRVRGWGSRAAERAVKHPADRAPSRPSLSSFTTGSIWLKRDRC